MRKSNKPIAGYHLLMILSAVDGIIKPEEGLKVQEYMAEEFPFRLNLDDELEIIAQLNLTNGRTISNSMQNASRMILQKKKEKTLFNLQNLSSKLITM